MAAEADAPGWLEFSVRAGVEAVDAISEVFRRHGARGVAVEPQFVSGSDEGWEAGPECVLKAYLPSAGTDSSAESSIEEDLWHLSAFDLAPISPLRRRVVVESDWANAWKEHFHPIRLGRHLVVKPSWREHWPRAGDVVIELDPGVAFGTGLHPSTALMMEALEARVQSGARVLDVGTGSGILAIAAAKLGAGTVVGVDTDAVSCRVARENATRNGVADRLSIGEGSIDASSGEFDVIAANIIASVIAELAPEFVRRMRAESVLLASGIIAERADLVRRAFESANLRILEQSSRGDWLCLAAAVS